MIIGLAWPILFCIKPVYEEDYCSYNAGATAGVGTAALVFSGKSMLSLFALFLLLSAVELLLLGRKLALANYY